MSLVSLGKKLYVVASDNLLLKRVLNSNTGSVFVDYDVNNPISKIDILIVDSKQNIDLLSWFKVNIIIDLTSEVICERAIIINKPFYLQELMDIINNNKRDDKLFCLINNKWIYHERVNSLFSEEHNIVLTEKENQIFRTILTSNNLSIDRKELSSIVWDYHRDNESTTLETHIYKLKYKLPKGLFAIKNLQYSLSINELS